MKSLISYITQPPQADYGYAKRVRSTKAGNAGSVAILAMVAGLFMPCVALLFYLATTFIGVVPTLVLAGLGGFLSYLAYGWLIS